MSTARLVQRSVIVAMVPVLVVQAVSDEVVDVIPVRHGGMTAIRSMNVAVRMGQRVIRRGATFRIGGGHGEDMFLHGAILVLVVQMAIVQEINVALVLHGDVTAAFAVLVVVVWMGRAHGY